MKPTKKDFQITQFDKDRYRVSIRKRILFIFWLWIELTEVDGDKEVPVDFNTFDECNDFINSIVEL